MSKQKKVSMAKRREFLKLAGLGTLAGATAAASGARVAQAASQEDGAAGYRETAHVKKVYELSKF